MKSSRKHSQSIVEYLLLLTVLLLVFFAAFANKESPLRKGLNEYVEELGDAVSDVIDK